jgi:hypothetical protein
MVTMVKRMRLGCYVIRRYTARLVVSRTSIMVFVFRNRLALNSFAALCIDMWQHQIAVKQTHLSDAHKQLSWPIHWQNCDLISPATLFKQPDTLANACDCVTRQHFKMLVEYRRVQNTTDCCSTVQFLTLSKENQIKYLKWFLCTPQGTWGVSEQLHPFSTSHPDGQFIFPSKLLYPLPKSPGNHWRGVCVYR